MVIVFLLFFFFCYRFVFYECTSMKLDDKVTFPLVGLSVGQHLYDLYACVCHFGGMYFIVSRILVKSNMVF